jgi:hypothetical protein
MSVCVCVPLSVSPPGGATDQCKVSSGEGTIQHQNGSGSRLLLLHKWYLVDHIFYAHGSGTNDIALSMATFTRRRMVRCARAHTHTHTHTHTRARAHTHTHTHTHTRAQCMHAGTANRHAEDASQAVAKGENRAAMAEALAKRLANKVKELEMRLAAAAAPVASSTAPERALWPPPQPQSELNGGEDMGGGAGAEGGGDSSGEATVTTPKDSGGEEGGAAAATTKKKKKSKK